MRLVSILPLAMIAVFRASAADEDAFFTGPSTMDQSSAEAYCVDNGGHLASINSQMELDAARAVCVAASSSCWIGLHSDDGNSGPWSWTDGSALDFGFNSDGTPTTGINPWDTGEPNDSGSEDCVELRGSSARYNDLECHGQLIPLCEKSQDADCASIPIDAYLTSCSDEFAANELDIESLQSAQSEVTERLDAAETAVSDNSERIDGLADAADAVEGTLQSVQSELDAAKADITTNDGRMDALESAADTRDDTIDSVQSDLEAAEMDISANSERIDNLVDAVEGTLQSVQSELDKRSILCRVIWIRSRAVWPRSSRGK